MAARVDTDILRTFVAIAETGSFTRAAEIVGRTQSAASMQMRRLEDMVGKRLFHRSASGVRPTASGERLLGDALRILALTDRFVAAPDDTGLDGSIRIGIPEEYGSTLLPRALAGFARSHPRVEIVVHCEGSDCFAPALQSGELDLAVIASRPGTEQGEILFHDPTVWVGQERLLAEQDGPVPLALFDSGCWWRGAAIRAMDEAGLPYRIAVSSASVAGIQAAVRAGLAIAVLGASTVPDGVPAMSRGSGLPTLPGSNITLQRRPGAPSPAMARMAGVIADAFPATSP